uniref:Peptidase M10 metallopeptidase domain-containing protein n=1 Tax=Acrobeloides nanus TaxID=290746 RepID=A0A914CIH9_9BILA
MIHFDDDEYWAYMDNEAIESEEYTDILNTAIHEIGHAIGIDHIEAKPEAIMAPFYRYTRDAFGNYIPPKLTTFDIAAAQAIYGARKMKTNDEDDNGYNPPSN